MTTKITNLLVKAIVFLGVFGIMFLLVMYNAKLLHSLDWFNIITDANGKEIANRIFPKKFDNAIIIIAAIAYSLGSIAVVIWYNPTQKEDETKRMFLARYFGSIILKLLFVTIDGLHVYIYSGSGYIGDLSVWLAPVYAVQTILILFFVGAIVNDFVKNGNKKEVDKQLIISELESKIELKESNIEKLESNIKSLKSNIETFNTSNKELKSELDDTIKMNKDYKSQIEHQQKEIEVLKSNIIDYKSSAKELHAKLKEKQDLISKYYPVYLKSEVARIRKMKPENRSEEDTLLLHSYEQE